MIDDNFSHNHKTDSPPIVEPRVAIIGDSALTRAIVMKPRAMGMTTMLADNTMIAKNTGVEPEPARTYILHPHQVNSRGKLVPIKTTVAAKFPLLSRRQRRAIQREISKAADKSTIK